LLPGLRHRLTALRQDGERFEAEVTLGQGRTEFDELITVVFLRDITEQIAYEQTLAKARNDAMAADEAKARFLAVMSHEMRTPLNGLLSAVDLLSRTTRLDKDQDWLVDIIRTCGTTTLDQVNNVLLLARMSNADGNDHPAGPVRLNRFLAEITKQFAADAKRAGNTLRLVGTDVPSSVVMLPAQLLRRAVGNLLSNAVKFTTNGSITVELTETPASTPDRVAVRITVADTGIGIAAADIDRIFRNFETLDVSYARVREGSGLGLGIVKLSVEEIGGRVETYSELGKGSRFSLVFEAPQTDLLPEDDHDQPKLDDLDPASLAGLTVLIADDNALNRTLMARQLATLGARAVLASDGAEAVALAEKTVFDVILMDISMPVVDGMQATQMIRAGGASRDVPVIAITAQASRNRAAEFRDVGMQDVLTKPAAIQEVVAAIRSQVRHALPRPDAAEAATATPPPAPILPPEQEAQDMLATMQPSTQGDDLAQRFPGFAALVADLGPEFMAQMVCRFRTDTETALNAARETLDSKDLAGLKRLVHSAAGAAAAIGLDELGVVLRRCEDSAAAGQAAAAGTQLAEAAAIYARDIEILRR
jgi:signal transduction histidine kinase/DNA-binding NarL/FixJ family response regulator/HPt (histidine-containing phosphotransfer) domain-containing protein